MQFLPEELIYSNQLVEHKKQMDQIHGINYHIGMEVLDLLSRTLISMVLHLEMLTLQKKYLEMTVEFILVKLKPMEVN